MNAAALDNIDLLLPYQAKFFQDQSAVKIAVKSRRIGISWSTAMEAVLTAAASKGAGGSDVLYLSQSIRDSEEFTLMCADFSRSLDMAFREDRNVECDVLAAGENSIRVTKITFASGFRIMLLPGTRPSALRGKQGLVIFDEAALLDMEDCLAAAEAFQMWGGRIIFISTQASADNGFNVHLLERAEEMNWSVHTTTIHDAVNDGLYRRICLVKGWEWSEEREAKWVSNLLKSPRAGQEYLCIPGHASGIYISRALVEERAEPCNILRLHLPAKWELKPKKFRESLIKDWITAHLVPELRKLDPDKMHAWGLDFGRAAGGDLSVFWPLAIDDDLTRRTPFLIEMTGVPFDEQETIFWTAIEAMPRVIGGKCDMTGVGRSVAEHAMQRYGEAIVEGVSFSRSKYAEMLPDLRAAFEREELYVPKNSAVVNDFSVFIVDDATNLPVVSKRKTDGEHGEKRHGDSAIACMLAHAASKGAAVKIRTVKTKRHVAARKRGW